MARDEIWRYGLSRAVFFAELRQARALCQGVQAVSDSSYETTEI